MRHLFTLCTLTCIFLVSPQLKAASDLSSLSEKAREAISRLCSPVQYREGAAAYRQCVQSEIDSAQQGGNTEFSTLGFDDKYAVQQYCADAGVAYGGCVASQVAAVRNVPTPSMNNISEDEQYAIQQTCFTAQSSKGLLAYRQCVLNEIASLEQLPRIDLATLSIVDRNALQLRCSANSQTAAAYRQCLSVEFSSFTDVQPSFVPDAKTTAPGPAIKAPPVAQTPEPTQAATAQPTATPEPTSETSPESNAELTSSPSTEAAIETPAIIEASLPISNVLPRNIAPLRASDSPEISTEELTLERTPESAELVTNTSTESSVEISTESIELSPTAGTDNSLLDTRVISKPALVEQVAQIETESSEGVDAESSPVARIIDTIKQGADRLKTSLDSLTPLGKAIGAALLALPLLAWIVKRAIGRKRQRELQLWEQQQQLRYKAAKSPRDLEARWQEELLDTDDTRQTVPYKAPQADRQPTPSEASDTTATRFVQRQPPQETEVSPNIRWQSGFGSWLEKEPAELQRQHSIEFLIYWMAYGDERYTRSLKEKVFMAQDPNAHDFIKRWVLKQDVFAFADTINWLKFNTDKGQQEQILDLLMALLITEKGLTPNQNVLLRILTDAFGLGIANLESRFENAFQESLPPFPRPDKQNWWLEQPQDLPIRWDVRRQASLPEFEQYAIRLGLQRDFTDTDVANAFRRAAKRCHPDRFSRLGEREQSLAQNQFGKFEQARDGLLGVSA